jgi:hypothetical protein
MAGLYDGLEEVPFKRIASGYVFQTNNPWFIGPKHRYVVNDAQKAEIAACIRETFRRMKPFVFAAMVLIPAILVGSIYWFATRGGTLTVTISNSDGRTTSYSQSIGPHGTGGMLPEADGSSVRFHVSGLPGAGATMTATGMTAAGKVGTPCTVRFDASGTTITITDDKNHVVRTVKLVGRRGPTLTALTIFAALVSLALFSVYVGLIHVYSRSRLQPLVAGLPPTDERIRFSENVQRFGVNVSTKLLAVMGISAIVMLLGNAFALTNDFVSNSASANPMHIVTMLASVLVTAQVAVLAALKMKHAQSVSAPPPLTQGLNGSLPG